MSSIVVILTLTLTLSKAKWNGEVEGPPDFARTSTVVRGILLPMQDRRPCVYIFSNVFRTLYIGVTSDLEQRVWHHKNGTYPGSFSARYKLDHLVYVEYFDSMPAAIRREKQLKGWLRQKKIALVIAHNPTWQDLSAEWEEPIFYEETEAKDNDKSKSGGPSTTPLPTPANKHVRRGPRFRGSAQDDDE